VRKQRRLGDIVIHPKLLTQLAITAATVFLSAATCAQQWQPTKPLEIVVATAPGGGVDRTARLVQKIITDEGLVKVPITVTNKPGAGGAIQVNYLNQHAGDAHFAGVTIVSLITNDLSGRGIRYTDVTPLANLFSEYLLIAVRSDGPWNSGKEFMAQLRKDPTSLAVNVGIALGTSNHVAYALLAKSGGVDPKKVKAVVLGGSANAVTMLVGGHVDASVNTPSAVRNMVLSGKLRGLGILAPKRVTGPFADTPTWTELGYPVVVDTWRGLIGPKGLTSDQIAFWDELLRRVVSSKAWKNALEQNLQQDNYLNSAQTRRLFDDEYAQYRDVLNELGMLK
jgi:putative tricarboxylic transport membrane protein